MTWPMDVNKVEIPSLQKESIPPSGGNNAVEFAPQSSIVLSTNKSSKDRTTIEQDTANLAPMTLVSSIELPSASQDILPSEPILPARAPVWTRNGRSQPSLSGTSLSVESSETARVSNSNLDHQHPLNADKGKRMNEDSSVLHLVDEF